MCSPMLEEMEQISPSHIHISTQILYGRNIEKQNEDNVILGRIADQLHLGEDHQVSVLGPAARGEHRGGIASDIADRLVKLCERDGKRIDHALFPKHCERVSQCR